MTTEICERHDHGNLQHKKLRLIQNDHGNFQRQIYERHGHRNLRDHNLRLIQNDHGNFQRQTQTTMEIFKIKFALYQK